MKIVIGSDHRGSRLKVRLIPLITELRHEVSDIGTSENTSVDYPDFAAVVAGQVSRREVDRGILICGTGIGMCIAANKFPGVRAATCHDELTAEMCRRHNDVNVLCLSGDMLGERPIDGLLETWLNTGFEGQRHARRVDKINGIERQIANQDGVPKAN